MANITEDYVSFETAKLLKKKGFEDIDCECHGWIGRSGKHYSADDTFYDDEELKKAQEDRKDFVPLITLQTAMKWLREVHNIVINIGWGEILEDKFQWWCIILNFKDGSILRESEYYATYEEAGESAIKYCIENLI
jgi:hypothetical protein